MKGFKEWLKQNEMAGGDAIIKPGTKATDPSRSFNVWGSPETQGRPMKQAQRMMNKDVKTAKK